MARERLYLSYEGNPQRGVPPGRLEVYPEDIDRNFATRLYTQRTPNGPLERAMDAETRINNQVDISLLRSVADELALRLYERASSQPETAALYEGLAAVVSDDLITYSQQVASGKLGDARQTLEAMSRKLLAATNRTNPAPESIDKDKLLNDTAQTLSVEIETGLSLYQELEKLQSQLDTLRKEVAQAAPAWSLSDEDTSVRSHLAWLADDTTGFKAQLSVFFLTPASGQESAIQRLRDEAHGHLEALRALISNTETARQQMRDRAQPVLDLAANGNRLVTQLQKVKKTILMLPSDTVSEVVNNSELLTAHERERWDHYNAHQFFGNLDRVRVFFADQAERIRRRIDDAPRLSSDALSTMAEAQRSIDRLQSRLEMLPAAPTRTPPPVASSSLVATPRITRATAIKTQTGTVDQERLDEIYLLAVAVASHKYCGPRHLVGMTVRSVLGILGILGKVSEEEQVAYHDSLTEKIAQRSVTVDDNLKIRDLWERTDPQAYDWIYFKPQRRWLWRLVKKAQLPGQFLAKNFGLTKEAIEAASEQRSEQYMERRRKNER